MIDKIEKFGTVGTIFMAFATALPCCLPLLAATGATLGLSIFAPYQTWLNYLLQALVVLAVAAHFKAYFKHRNHWLISLTVLSAIGIFIGYNFIYSAAIIYPSLSGLIVAAIWHSFINRNNKGCLIKNVILESVLTCPSCGFSQLEKMPTDFCLYFYKCRSCKTELKPKSGDCCVFCSYGSVKCPPMQTDSCLCH